SPRYLPLVNERETWMYPSLTSSTFSAIASEGRRAWTAQRAKTAAASGSFSKALIAALTSSVVYAPVGDDALDFASTFASRMGFEGHLPTAVAIPKIPDMRARTWLSEERV